VSQGYLKSREGIAGELSARIDTLFAPWDCDHSPGAVVAVYHGGAVIHQRGYGVANIEDDVPFTADTVLRLGSTTKHLCATCILVLENQGKLSLGDDIRQFVPEMPDYGVVITLRHLLTMTSGLWDGINILLFAGLDVIAPIKRDQFLHLYPGQKKLMFNPGDDCTYSNTNYSLLGLVIERISGMSIAEFMQAELFQVLGMDRTSLTPYMQKTVANMAKGYVPNGDGAFEAGYMMIEMDGAGGVDSTITDMLKWFANYRDDQHFGPDYRQRMEAQSRLNDGRLLDYRLGINVMDYRGMEVVRHAGGMPGYLCDFVFFPQADLGIVLFTNLLDPAMLQLPDRIADIVLENEFDLPLETTFLDTAREDVAALAGVYASEGEGLVLELADQDGKLVCYLLGDINPLHECEGWLQSRKNLVSVRMLDPLTGQGDGLELRLGCQAPYQMAVVADPRAIPISPPGDFESFTGHYYHEGFEEVHKVSLRENKLRVDIPSPMRDLVWGELTPVTGDLFVALIEGEPSCTDVTAKFLRDGNGRVTAISYSLNRCRDVVFHKLKTGQKTHETD
jgi:CubicO group peptidase (beta-lactamase class C family)